MKKVYLLSVIMALTVGIAVYVFASSLEQKAQPVNIETKSVVAAVQDIPANTLITEDMISLVSLPVQAVHRNAATDPSKVIGQITKYPLVAYEQILVSRLGELGESADALSFQIENNYRAITVEVSEVTGVAGYIEEGDYVDIVATLMLPVAEGGTSYAVSTMLAENILVLKTGMKQVSGTEAQTVSYESVTMRVTPEQALMINYAAANGRLRLVLRPVLDDAIVQPDDFPPPPLPSPQAQNTAE
ncbi:MAG: SAF domain protein [Firmicutes bacterium ADurb.Bin182]|nr:MAG: SAF domain protein [Firmicutes bacterium ADurb.Bin182]